MVDNCTLHNITRVGGSNACDYAKANCDYRSAEFFYCYMGESFWLVILYLVHFYKNILSYYIKKVLRRGVGLYFPLDHSR